MKNDEIDEMLTGAVPTPHPGRRREPGTESPRSLSETSENRGHVGQEEDRIEPPTPEIDRTKRGDPPRAPEKLSDDLAMEILGKTKGTKESGDDFLTAATCAAGHAVRTVAAEFKDPAESARAIIAGVLRGAGENEDTALKTLSLAASTVVREALLLGHSPTPWIEGILSGAVDGARDLGLDRENAVSAAAQGILNGADKARFEPAAVIGTALERTIRATLVSSAAPARRSEAS